MASKFTQLHPQHPSPTDLKGRVDCRDLARALGLQSQQERARYTVFQHPHEAQRTPSFTVYERGFRDYKTNDSGDLFGLIQLVLGYDFPTAYRYATEFAGYAAPSQVHHKIVAPRRRTVAVTNQPAAPSSAWQAAASKVITHAEQLLHSAEGASALRYLVEARGLTLETIRQARLGYLPGPRWFRTSYQYETADQPLKNAHLPPGIVIPCFAADGQISYLKVRTRTGAFAAFLGTPPDCLDGKALDKYRYLTGGDAQALYHVAPITAERKIIFLEGEFDVLVGQQAVTDQVTFVTRGSATSSLSPKTLTQLAVAPQVIVIADNDDAGHKGASIRVRELLSVSQQVAKGTLSNAKDLTEFAAVGGDIRTWAAEQIATAPRYFHGLPDGIRAALRKCSLDALLVCLELAHAAGLREISVGGLLSANGQLGTRLSRSTVKRGVKQWGLLSGQKGLSDETATGSNAGSNLNPNKTQTEIEKISGTPNLSLGFNFEPLASDLSDSLADPLAPKVYPLPSHALLRDLLSQRLPYAIYESCFKGQDWLPRMAETAMLVSIGFTEDEADARIQATINSLEATFTTTERERYTEKAKLEYRIMQQFFRNLEKPTITPLPITGWRNASGHLTVLFRAQVEAGEQNRSRTRLTIDLGCSAGTVTTLLARAGVVNEEQPLKAIQLDDQKGDLIVQMFTQAKQNQARIMQVVALTAPPLEAAPDTAPHAASNAAANASPTATTYRWDNPAAAQAWIREQRAAGASRFVVNLSVAAQQRIVTEAIPPSLPRPVRRVEVPSASPPIAPQSAEADAAQAAAPAFAPPPKVRQQPRLETGYSADWLVANLSLTYHRVLGYWPLVGMSLREIVEQIARRGTLRAAPPIRRE